MSYNPHGAEDIKYLLDSISCKSVDELFDSIPSEFKFKSTPQVEHAADEQGIFDRLVKLAKKNIDSGYGSDWTSFLGAGSYAHYVPSAVDTLASRAEFFTSYTPYQAEISQGNLQVGFEFQSLIANLYHLDVANASMYDGANALVEAVLMARRVKKGETVLVSEGIHPQYIEVLNCYAKDLFDIKLVPVDIESGQTKWDGSLFSKDVFAVAVQTPNFFGVLEDLKEFAALAEKHGVVTVGVNNEPIAFGAIKPFGEFGVDIVAGEGQSLGNPVSFGGPHLGILATKKKYLRQLPGRLVGKTVDQEGKPGYVLTLSTREQHIRREKATSNICTNQFLLALRACIYMSLKGQRGLQKLAFENAKRMQHLLSLAEKAGIKRCFSGSVFNEVALNVPRLEQRASNFDSAKVIPGVFLNKYGVEEGLLVSVSELHSTDDIENLINLIKD